MVAVQAESARLTTPGMPPAGAHRLSAIGDTARAASGAATRLIVRGPVVALDPGVELAAHRIVQEALANARRHAPGAAADVRHRHRHRRGDAVTAGSPGRPAVRIVVADDHHVVRTGFASMLDTQPDFTVIGTAADGADAVEVCHQRRPDVVLMPATSPGRDRGRPGSPC